MSRVLHNFILDTVPRTPHAEALMHGERRLDYPALATDTVRRDADGCLYHIDRDDELIKVSDYRISPAEVEEALYASGQVDEAAVFGVPQPEPGLATIVPALTPTSLAPSALLNECQRRLPAYMVLAYIDLRRDAFPRNPTTKLDRKLPFTART